MRNYSPKIAMIAAATSLISFPVFAASEQAPFNGPYVGGALTLHDFGSGATVSPSATITLDDKNKVGGGIYGGYGVQMDQIYFGLEGGFYLNNTPEPTFSFDTTNGGLKAKNTFDISGRAGFVAEQVLFYGLGGYTNTKFDTTGLAANVDKRLGGFRYGGGIEFAMTPQFSIRAEYTRAEYKKWDVASGTNTITLDPDENRFLIGASFHF